MGRIRQLFALLAIAALVVMPVSVSAASYAYTPGLLAISLNAVAATGAGDDFAIPRSQDGWLNAVTWQIKHTGTPTAISVNLEGSIDGTTWATLDTAANTDPSWSAASGEIRHVVNKPVRFVRCNIASYTVNGSTTTCQFIAQRI